MPRACGERIGQFGQKVTNPLATFKNDVAAAKEQVRSDVAAFLKDLGEHGLLEDS